ncbi:MAG: hypothetical protein KGI97_01405, partial [Alphaproteobacteria bacterium]|nr:hypothetical protein [Alphaproteobacteria bacterium]
GRALAFSNVDEFNIFVSGVIEDFRNFIENNGGWSLLWNENETPKREEATQLTFLGIALGLCKFNNVDVSKEVNIGRGPVDFKMSSGYTCRALIEVKLAKNTRFWQGLEKQLPKYMQAEGVKQGRFVVVVLNDQDLEKIADIQERVDAIARQTPYQIKAEIIDARQNPLSASKL